MFYIRKNPLEYENIDQSKFNIFLTKILRDILDNHDETIVPVSKLIHRMKDFFREKELDIYIKMDNEYKRRNINTYIKTSYGSFVEFLHFNDIKAKSVMCVTI